MTIRTGVAGSRAPSDRRPPSSHSQPDPMATTTNATSAAAATQSTNAVSRTSTAAGASLGDRDTFLRLLVAQLQNQDPMNPSQPEEMAAQLAQFSSLEAQIAIRDLLQGQQLTDAQLQHALDTNAAIATIGHEVMARGDHVVVGTQSDVTVDVGGAGGEATLRIFDRNGKEVAQQRLGVLSAGEQTISIVRATSGLDAGDYTYAVDVSNADGQGVDVQAYERFVVDAVEPGANGPVLCAGDRRVSFVDLVRVGPPHATPSAAAGALATQFPMRAGRITDASSLFPIP